MRIDELITPVTKDIPIKGSLAGYKTPPEGASMGAYSHVTPNPDEHMVTKTTRKGLAKHQTDGFWVFVDAIVESGIHNPYFPRVYSIKKFTDPNGLQKRRFQTEKLLHYSDASISFDELESVAEKMFTPKCIQSYFGQYAKSDGYFAKLARSHNADIATQIAHLVDAAMDGNGTHNILDESLLEAIQFVSKLSNEKNYFLDFHRENGMYRRTKNGLQFVINDPLSSPKDY